MPLNYFVTKNNKKLRCGCTTGSCAVMAAKAAMETLFSGDAVKYVEIDTPKGITVGAEVIKTRFDNGGVLCCVIKDGGDDIDVTNGLEISAFVKKTDERIRIDGGKGVGRVTKRGLDCEVGSAAINSTPRKLLREEALKICRKYKYSRGIDIIISVAGGEEAAKKTFNPRLGIEGGISIIGTSGIVEPMSMAAIVDTIDLEMRMLRKNGLDSIIAVPGNYGEVFIKGIKEFEKKEFVKFSNFVGDFIDIAVKYEYHKALLIGHVGKFVKLAGGIMNTHSSFADCRMEILTAHAAMFAEAADVRGMMNCVNTEEALEVLDSLGITQNVMDSIVSKAEFYANNRSGGKTMCGVIIYSDVRGILASGEIGKALFDEFGGNYE